MPVPTSATGHVSLSLRGVPPGDPFRSPRLQRAPVGPIPVPMGSAQFPHGPRRTPMPSASPTRVSSRILLSLSTLALVLAGTLSTPAQAAKAKPKTTTSVSWPQFRNTSDHVGVNTSETQLGPSNVGGVGLVWTFSAGDQIQASPTVVGGVLYVGSYDNTFYALNASTGAK